MRNILISVLIASLFGVIPVFGIDVSEVNIQTVDWKDITQHVFANPADKAGWHEDDDGKIYKNEEGTMIRIVTSDFGEFLVLLDKEPSAYQIKSGETIALEDYTLLNRDRGKSLVLRNDTFKIRCIMDEKVQGMDNVSGIKGF